MTAARRTTFGLRAIGAMAGIAPAAVIVGYYLVTGGPLQPGLVAIVAAAVVGGWLAGPLATGPLRVDAIALVAYVLAGYLLNIAAASVASIADDVAGGLVGGPSMVVGSIAGLIVPSVIYLPVFALFLAPAGLAWILVMRLVRGRFRHQPVGRSDSKRRAA